MINASDELKEAFLAGRQKNLTLNFDDGSTLTNDDIVVESMVIEQMLCSEPQMTFGVVAASSFKIDIFYTPMSYVGMWVDVFIETENQSIKLGKFKIDESPVSDDHNKRTLIGYDKLYDVLNTNYADWYKELTLPKTLKEFRDAFFTEIGIVQENKQLVNDSITVERTVALDTLSGSQILQRILELNGAFGFVTNLGKFKYVTYEAGFGTFPSEDLYPQQSGLYPSKSSDITFVDEESVVLNSLIYDDYDISQITGIKLRQDDEDEGAFVGTDENIYCINGNFLVFGKNSQDLESIALNILGFVNKIIYRPVQCKVRCHPWMELGDIIRVISKNGNVLFPIFERTITGITALYDEYRAQGQQFYSYTANNITNMVENLQSKTLRIVQNVDEVSTTLATTTQRLDGRIDNTETLISQTATEITAAYTEAISDAESDMQEYTDNRITIDRNGVHIQAVKSSGAEATLDLGYEYVAGTSNTKAILKVNADNIELSASETIDLMSGGTINLTTENINISSTNFAVDRQGNVTAHSLTLDGGTIDISSGSGSSYREFKVNQNGTLEIHLANLDLDTDGTLSMNKGSINLGVISGGYNFTVDSSGYVVAKHIEIDGGTIDIHNNSSGSNYREFKVNSDGTLEIHLANLDLETDGTLNMEKGSINLGYDSTLQDYKFKVDNNGNLTARNAQLYGSLITESGVKKAELTSGDLNFYYNDSKLATYTWGAWKYTQSMGNHIVSPSGAEFIAFGQPYGSLTNYVSEANDNLIINYGCDPFGIEEGIIAFSGMCANKITFFDGEDYHPDDWFMEPTYYQTIITYNSYSDFPARSESGHLYYARSTDAFYRPSSSGGYINMNTEHHANWSTLPTTGSTNVVYVMDDTGDIYLWSYKRYIHIYDYYLGFHIDPGAYMSIGDSNITYISQRTYNPPALTVEGVIYQSQYNDDDFQPVADMGNFRSEEYLFENVVANSRYTLNCTFDTPMRGTPRVVATPICDGQLPVDVCINNVSASGYTIILKTGSAGYQYNSMYVHVIAFCDFYM